MQSIFSWARSILGILAGGAVIAVLAFGLFTLAGSALRPSILATLITPMAGILFAGIGGYVTGIVVRGGEIRHAFALGVILFLLGIFSAMESYSSEPLWSQITLALGALPAALIGGYLRAHQLRHVY